MHTQKRLRDFCRLLHKPDIIEIANLILSEEEFDAIFDEKLTTLNVEGRLEFTKNGSTSRVNKRARSYFAETLFSSSTLIGLTVNSSVLNGPCQTPL